MFSSGAAVRLVLFSLVFFLPRTVLADIDAVRCQAELARLMTLKRGAFADLRKPANAEKMRFVKEVLYPVVGLRATHVGADDARKISVTDDRMVIGGFGDDDNLRFEWSDTATEPHFEDLGHERRMVIPKGYDFAEMPDRGAGLIRRFLVGHALHPYDGDKRGAEERVALGEDAFHLKQVQKQGMQAAVESIEDGHSRYLYVGPTGTGKSEVMMRVLDSQIERNAKLDESTDPDERRKARRLSIVVADKNFLVDQLHGDVKNLKTDREVVVVRWGGTEPELQPGQKPPPPPPDLDEIIQMAEKSGKHVVLVTTVQSLIPKIEQDTELYAEALRDVLATVAFDEAHHAGAEKTRPILEKLLSREQGSKAFLYGTTATPTHRDVELVSEVFGERAFWAYLDDPKTFRERGGRMDRDVAEIVDQLYLAIQRGELSPFQTHFMDPNRFTDAGGDLFVSSKKNETGSRFVLNPKQYGNVIRRLKPALDKHQRGFLTMATKDEAEDFTEALRDAYGVNKDDGLFATLHSGLSSKEQDRIKADFRAGKIRFLVTVRMMDEGINIPDLTFMADLTRTTPPKQLLQRIGRVLRIHRGKRKPVEIYSFQDVNDLETAQFLLDLNNVSKGHDPDVERTRPDPKAKVEEVRAEREDHGDLQSMEWQPRELRATARDFWLKPPSEAKQRGRADAEDVVSFFRVVDWPLDGFARPGSGRVDPVHLNVAERTLHNRLAKHFDAKKTGADGYKGFEEILESQPRQIRDGIEKFRLARDRRKEQVKTPEGTAEALVEFVTSYRRVPRESEGTDDEKAFHDAIQRVRTDVNFLHALYDKASGPDGRLKDPALDKFLGVSTRFGNPEDIAHMADAFYVEHERVPGMEAGPFERALAQAMAAHPTALSALQNRDLKLELDLIAEEKAAALARLKQGKAEEDAARLKLEAERAKDRGSEIVDLVALSNRAGRALLPDGIRPDRIELVISGPKNQGMGVERLADFYTQAAKEKGFTVTLSSIDARGDYCLRIEGSNVAENFASEGNVQHRVQYDDKGKSVTNDLKVQLRTESGVLVAPQTRDGKTTLRTYRTKDEVIKDAATGGTYRIGKGKKLSTLRQWQVDLFTKDIDASAGSGSSGTRPGEKGKSSPTTK